jgi:hypothetical protein
MAKIPALIVHCILGAIIILETKAAETPAAAARAYSTGWESIAGIGEDIQTALKAMRDKSAVPRLALEHSPAASVKVAEADGKTPRVISVSDGMVDVINCMAHAKAIDTKERNYYTRYVQTLSVKSGEPTHTPIPDRKNDLYWCDDVMNEQISNFNSVAGILVSINFASEYLGQNEKYQKLIAASKGRARALNNVLTPDEYEKAFTEGVRNALQVGITVEGLCYLLDGVGKMKVRPDWAIYFLPDSADCSKLKKTMKRVQADFFSGKGQTNYITFRKYN